MFCCSLVCRSYGRTRRCPDHSYCSLCLAQYHQFLVVLCLRDLPKQLSLIQVVAMWYRDPQPEHPLKQLPASSPLHSSSATTYTTSPWDPVPRPRNSCHSNAGFSSSVNTEQLTNLCLVWPRSCLPCQSALSKIRYQRSTDWLPGCLREMIRCAGVTAMSPTCTDWTARVMDRHSSYCLGRFGSFFVGFARAVKTAETGTCEIAKEHY